MKAGGWFCVVLTGLLLAGGCKKKAHDVTTPLHEAVEAHDLGRVQALIARGASINRMDDWGRTPLHEAAAAGYKEIVEILVRCGARLDPTDKQGRRPVMEAMQRGHRAVVEYLVRKGAAETLIVAIYLGDVAKTQSLIEGGADVNAGAGSAWTPLHYAAGYDQRAAAERLIAGGARLDARDLDGFTPLHVAAREGHLDMARLLLTQGADVDANDNQGETPLYGAIEKDHGAVAAVLISRGANVNVRPRYGGATLPCRGTWAGQRGSAPDRQGSRGQRRGGRSPAPRNVRGHRRVVELLLANGADVNAQRRTGSRRLWVDTFARGGARTRQGHDRIAPGARCQRQRPSRT